MGHWWYNQPLSTYNPRLVSRSQVVSFNRTLVQVCTVTNTILGQTCSKNPNFQFKLRFFAKSNLIMQNSMVVAFFFLFVFLRLEMPFLGKFSINSHFKLEFGTKTNSNMKNSMMRLTFSVFDRKYPFGQICSQNSKLFV